jgi:hypothetical protein
VAAMTMPLDVPHVAAAPLPTHHHHPPTHPTPTLSRCGEPSCCGTDHASFPVPHVAAAPLPHPPPPTTTPPPPPPPTHTHPQPLRGAVMDTLAALYGSLGRCLASSALESASIAAR